MAMSPQVQVPINKICHPPAKPDPSPIAVPYHHDLELERLFDTPRGSLVIVREFFQSKGRPVLARQLDSADQFLEVLSVRFCHTSQVTPDETRHILLLFLQQLYDSIHHYIALECDSESVAAMERSPVHGLTMIPHDQVGGFFEKEAQKLRLSDDMIERIEQFVDILHHQITRKTRNTSPKERIVERVKFWSDQIDALSHYTFRELGDDVVESVDHALKGIREVLDMRELGSVPLE
jgi:hypothetical protein